MCEGEGVGCVKARGCGECVKESVCLWGVESVKESVCGV